MVSTAQHHGDFQGLCMRLCTPGSLKSCTSWGRCQVSWQEGKEAGRRERLCQALGPPQEVSWEDACASGSLGKEDSCLGVGWSRCCPSQECDHCFILKRNQSRKQLQAGGCSRPAQNTVPCGLGAQPLRNLQLACHSTGSLRSQPPPA